MEFIKKNKYYLIFGVIFLIGIIMIIIGSSARNNKGIVIDNSLYYIDFVGENEITIYKGENYIEPGYKGYDDKGTDLTSNVEVTNNINSDVIGTYKVIYSLKNVVKERTVNVINKEPGATYIHLYGEVNTFLYVGEEYQEKGYEVIDTVDGGKLKDKVKVVSNVDTSKAGVYRVTYTVTNSSGITTTATRTVVVMNSEISVAINNNNYTNGNVKIEIYINDDMFEYLLLPDGNKVKEKIYTYQVTENGTYKFVMYNKKGQNKEESITVNNINKSNPSGSCSGSYKDGKTYINISASDDIGIARYVIDGASYTTNQITINREMNSANITIYDKAGNSTNISCNLENKNGKTPASSTNKPNPSTENKTVKPYSVESLLNKDLCDKVYDITAEDLNNLFMNWSNKTGNMNSPLLGTGDAWIKACEETGLDPLTLVGFCGFETGRGGFNAMPWMQKKNFFGLRYVDPSGDGTGRSVKWADVNDVFNGDVYKAVLQSAKRIKNFYYGKYGGHSMLGVANVGYSGKSNDTTYAYNCASIMKESLDYIISINN